MLYRRGNDRGPALADEARERDAPPRERELVDSPRREFPVESGRDVRAADDRGIHESSLGSYSDATASRDASRRDAVLEAASVARHADTLKRELEAHAYALHRDLADRARDLGAPREAARPPVAAPAPQTKTERRQRRGVFAWLVTSRRDGSDERHEPRQGDDDRDSRDHRDFAEEADRERPHRRRGWFGVGRREPAGEGHDHDRVDRFETDRLRDTPNRRSPHLDEAHDARPHRQDGRDSHHHDRPAGRDAGGSADRELAPGRGFWHWRADLGPLPPGAHRRPPGDLRLDIDAGQVRGAARDGDRSDNRHSDKPKPRRPHRLDWRIRLPLKGLGGALALLAVCIVSMLVVYTIRYPDPFALAAGQRSPVIRILDRNGRLLAERGRPHDYIPIALLPKHVVDAVIATEDRRFYSHWGIDPLGLVRAALANMRAGRTVQGGSTLTQQLAKNMFLSHERTFARKVEELTLAVWLEARLTKSEILELYLNRVYFGAGAYGIEAAAQRYFDKSARALSLAEAAMVAGMLQAPSRYSPFANPGIARSRARTVLTKMGDAGLVPDAVVNRAKGESLLFAKEAVEREPAGLEYAVDHVLEHMPQLSGIKTGTIVVETTIDADLQRAAQSIVTRTLRDADPRARIGQAALVVLDMDGGVRAMVGGRSYEQSQFNRVTRARRQPGSVFKPFVYLAALERGMTPDSTTYDLPIDIRGWAPKNADGGFNGTVTLRQGLAHSLNTVAVRLQQDIGTKTVIEMARRLGVTSSLREDASLALGTSEVNPLEVAGAYAVIANGGARIRPRAIRRVLTERGRVISAETNVRSEPIIAPVHVAAMNDMLGATLQVGTGRRAQLSGHPSAGKTGTTQDFRDAWFIGYTAQLTGAVWIGNDDGAAMDRITGGSLPAEIWREVMAYAHRQLPNEPLQGLNNAPARSRPPPRDAAPSAGLPMARATDRASATALNSRTAPDRQSDITGRARTDGSPPLPTRRATATNAPAHLQAPDRSQLDLLVRRDLAHPTQHPADQAARRPLPSSSATVQATISAAPGRPASAQAAVPRMPGERIGEDFIRRALAASPAGPEPDYTRGYDVEEVRRRLARTPDPRTETGRGLMSLGAP